MHQAAIPHSAGKTPGPPERASHIKHHCICSLRSPGHSSNGRFLGGLGDRGACSSRHPCGPPGGGKQVQVCGRGRGRGGGPQMEGQRAGPAAGAAAAALPPCRTHQRSRRCAAAARAATGLCKAQPPAAGRRLPPDPAGHPWPRPSCKGDTACGSRSGAYLCCSRSSPSCCRGCIQLTHTPPCFPARLPQAKDKKGVSKYDESKGAQQRGGDDTPLEDPIAEKLRQQRLIEEADYQATIELFGKGGRPRRAGTGKGGEGKTGQGWARGVGRPPGVAVPRHAAERPWRRLCGMPLPRRPARSRFCIARSACDRCRLSRPSAVTRGCPLAVPPARLPQGATWRASSPSQPRTLRSLGSWWRASTCCLTPRRGTTRPPSSPCSRSRSR